jgi:hypothetical protein
MDSFEQSFKLLISTQPGRDFLFEFMNRLGFWSSISADDPMALARLSARRNVATDLMDMFNEDKFTKGCFLQMMNENILLTEEEEKEDV